jgi:hypothetical protein
VGFSKCTRGRPSVLFLPVAGPLRPAEYILYTGHRQPADRRPTCWVLEAGGAPEPEPDGEGGGGGCGDMAAGELLGRG